LSSLFFKIIPVRLPGQLPPERDGTSFSAYLTFLWLWLFLRPCGILLNNSLQRGIHMQRKMRAGGKPEKKRPVAVGAANEEFVRVIDYIPELTIDLKYASADNFVGEPVYDFTEAYLRYGTVKKLRRVAAELAEQGYGLLLWDAFRPVGAQYRLWEAYPDPVYVADPNAGFSSHSLGNTVDVTLVRLGDGEPLPMPTAFDDFSPAADRDYSSAGAEAAANARLLEETMLRHGFLPNPVEWWHYTDADSYPAEESFSPDEF
jgi:D-alanyl-D-alanine dipeptidase